MTRRCFGRRRRWGTYNKKRHIFEEKAEKKTTDDKIETHIHIINNFSGKLIKEKLIDTISKKG